MKKIPEVTLSFEIDVSLAAMLIALYSVLIWDTVFEDSHFELNPVHDHLPRALKYIHDQLVDIESFEFLEWSEEDKRFISNFIDLR